MEDVKTGVKIKTTRVLGLDFVNAKAADLVHSYVEMPGLLVAPSAPSLNSSLCDPDYVAALNASRYILPDSGLLCLIWNILNPKSKLTRTSGLLFLKHFLQYLNKQGQSQRVLLVNPQESSKGFYSPLFSSNVDCYHYVAPVYSQDEVLKDRVLLEKLQDFKPDWVIINIAGGKQEKLAAYVLSELKFSNILCTGAALAFLSGEQVSIPMWADKYYLGGLFRVLSDPRRLFCRYMASFKIVPALFKQSLASIKQK